MRVKNFCISHIEIEYEAPSDWICLWTGQSGESANKNKRLKSIEVSKKDHLYACYQPFLTATAAAFMLGDMIEEGDPIFDNVDYLYISTCKKIIFNKTIGNVSVNFDAINVIKPTELSTETINKNIKEIKSEFLLGSLVKVQSILFQYSKFHHTQDLLRFIAIAIDEEAINSDEALEFMNFPYILIGAMELGLYRKDIFVKLNRILKKVAFSFIDRDKITSYDPYQRRAVSYCCERLASFLLFREINIIYGRIPPEILGRVTQITGSESYDIVTQD